ncbi:MULTISPECIES: MFS transporter [Micrococcus]|uniref:MFS transporter n=1 Tax=Micrococcus antarcticus TaxID=86171 RepID=UPI00384A7660
MTPTSSPAAAPGPADAHFTPEQRRVLAILLMPLFLSLMSVSVVNVALPAIESGLGASSADLQWVLSGYTLTFGVVLVAAGRAGDLWGRKPLFLAGIAVYVLGSLLAGLAWSPVVLNGARLLMGIGAGLFNPQIIGVIQSTFSGRARGTAYGMFGTVIGLGVAVGPLLGGLLMGLLGPEAGWRASFLVNAPIGLLALLLGVLWLHPPTRTAAVVPRGLRALDPVGVVLLGAATVSLMLPFILPGTWWLLAMAAALLTAWWLWEKRVRAAAPHTGVHPMVDPALLRRPSFTFATLHTSVYMGTMPGAFAVIAVFVQQGLGHSALAAGMITLASALLVTASSTWIGSQVHRFGPWFVFTGAALGVASMLALMLAFVRVADGAWPLWTLAALLIPQGASQALIMTSAQVLMMDDVLPEEAGSAGGVAQTAQRVGTSIGLAMVTGVYFSALAGTGHAPTAHEYGVAGGSALAVVAGSWALVLVSAGADLLRRRRSRARAA